ncbi:interferon regulatory factor 1-like [Uloborus diversus]|uniref:interferon regulatory factor 1-like n=1 Tax=Uloborus diversus TaxID=327109 RepID=UPI00240A526C|nr:interferon regulatory factor 1-like [Uloborus diversus]
MARPKFITKFLIPSLNEERFGPRLKWVDRRNAVFQLQWNHKAAHAWTEYDAQVFTEWDKMRGRYDPSKKGYFSRSKQRFRALLYKFTHDQLLRRLESSDKNIHKYCIVNWNFRSTLTSAFKKEVQNLKEKEEETMDYVRLWDAELNHSSDSEKENVNLTAVFKDHMYSNVHQVPQLTDLDDPFVFSDVPWAANLPSPNFYPICDLDVKDPPASEVNYGFDESHLHELEDGLHVELITLLETQQPLL